MVSKAESIRQTKKIRKYLNLAQERKEKFMDLITGIKMMEDQLNSAKRELEKSGLPTFDEIKTYHKDNGWN